MFTDYKSPLGYVADGKKIDTYGVDHSGFTTKDEIEYQMARQKRENSLIEGYNNQGITENYPQYSTNFWGNPDNNYGFGSSNIADNIKNKQRFKLQQVNTIDSKIENSRQQINNYLIPQEAYKNATWGDKTAQQLNNYMQAYDSYPGVTNTGVLAPFNYFIRNYEDMEKNALIGSDNFFHCKANYEAAKRGAWGELVGKGMSAARELYGLAKGEPFSDVRKDWHANQRGWNGAKQGLSLEQACPTDPKEYVEIKDYEDVF